MATHPSAVHVVSYGCHPDSHTAPVTAALDLLRAAGFELAELTEPHTWAGSGAYVDARRATGEVVLNYRIRGWQHEYQPRTMPAREYESLCRTERAERAATLTAYADVFRANTWAVREVYENRQGEEEEVLEGLIVLPPGSN